MRLRSAVKNLSGLDESENSPSISHIKRWDVPFHGPYVFSSKIPPEIFFRWKKWDVKQLQSHLVLARRFDTRPSTAKKQVVSTLHHEDVTGAAHSPYNPRRLTAWTLKWCFWKMILRFHVRLPLKCFPWCWYPPVTVTVNQLLLPWKGGKKRSKLKGGGVSRSHGFSLTWMCFSKAPDTAHGGHHHMLIPQDAQTEKKKRTPGSWPHANKERQRVVFKHSIFAGEKCASFVRV